MSAVAIEAVTITAFIFSAINIADGSMGAIFATALLGTIVVLYNILIVVMFRSMFD